MSTTKAFTLCGITLVAAASLSACSSDVPSAVDDVTDASAQTGGANGTGGSGVGGKGGKGGTSSAGGAHPGTGGAASGGNAGNGGTTSDGGAGNGGAGTGGSGTGGSGAGGSGTGGSGAGGAGTGGSGAGGAGTGGSGAGGAGTGGAGTGGAGAGGAGTGGSSSDSGSPCGNGVLDPGEECDPPNTAFCGADCVLGGDCTRCEEDNCGGAAIHTDCTSGTGGDLCAAAIQCARDNHCYQFDPGTCYCGTHDIASCQNPVGSPPNPANGPIGPCVDEFSVAASSSSASQVLLDLTDPSTALGRAGFMMQCDQAFCPSCFP